MALWSSILSPARATDWSAAGATITDRTGTPFQTLTSAATAVQINTAITNCSNAGGGIVKLGTGTFSLSSSLVMKNNVTLRGDGPHLTFLNFTNISGSGFFWGAGEVAVAFQGGYDKSGYGAAPGLGGVPPGTIRNWTGTNGSAGVYTQGATIINVDTTPTGLAVGDTLVLWQANDPDGSVPASTCFVSAKTGASAAVCWEGAETDTRASGQQQRSRVTNISGTNITITPGVRMPTGVWKTGNAPKAGWLKISDTMHDAGLEYLTLRTTTISSEHHAVVGMSWAVDCWLKGVGILPRNTTHQASNAVDYGVVVMDSRNVTVRDGWWDRMIGGGLFTSTSYGVALKGGFDCLVENNIFNAVESPMMILFASSGTVWGYNYERYVGDDSQEGGFQQHEVGSNMNLVEGNHYHKQWSDFFHGSTSLSTYNRNHNDGQTDLASYARWYNFIGNISAASTVYKALASDVTKYDRFNSGVCFRFGYPQQNADSSTTNGVALDNVVGSSAMLWGNYAVTGGTRFLSAEVPTGDPVFPNLLPADQTLPTSFYRNSRPAFFVTTAGTVAWPPIGPDVTSGAISGLAGHAHKIPAQLCYESAITITSFNPASFYSSSVIDTTPPSTPTGFTVT